MDANYALAASSAFEDKVRLKVRVERIIYPKMVKLPVVGPLLLFVLRKCWRERFQNAFSGLYVLLPRARCLR